MVKKLLDRDFCSGCYGYGVNMSSGCLGGRFFDSRCASLDGGSGHILMVVAAPAQMVVVAVQKFGL